MSSIFDCRNMLLSELPRVPGSKCEFKGVVYNLSKREHIGDILSNFDRETIEEVAIMIDGDKDEKYIASWFGADYFVHVAKFDGKVCGFIQACRNLIGVVKADSFEELKIVIYAEHGDR